MYRLSAELKISSAHQLRNYEGPCARVHGHNWKIKVEVSAKELDEIGMAIDFADLKKIAWQVIGKYDHNNFNELAPFDKINPTAENIARYFFNEIAGLLPDGIKLITVEIWETDKYKVAYDG